MRMNKKHLFIDMDGTLTVFENNRGKVKTRIDEFTGEFFETRTPCLPMIDAIKNTFDANEWEYHILSNSPSKECTEGKNRWLDMYFPIKQENRHFLEYDVERRYIKPKSNAILDYCFENDIELKDVLFIDDDYKNLVDVETLNVESWHPTKVLYKKKMG